MSTTTTITFRQWYEKKFKQRMPLYLRTEQKRKLYAQYLKSLQS